MTTGNATINSATPGNVLKDAIETAFAAHSNWTFIETVVITTTSWNIWKNHGTGVTDNNSFGSDFYVAIGYTTAGGITCTIKTFEAWDATGKLAIRPVPTGGQATNADASALATGGVVLSTSTMLSAIIQLTATPNTNEYYIAVSKNALKVNLRRSDLTTIYGLYAGIFEPLVTDANEFPLCMGGLATTMTNLTVGAFGTSRHPKRVSQAALTNQFCYNLINMTPPSGNTGNVDLFYNKIEAPRVGLVGTGGSTTSAPILGYLRGMLYDTVIVNPAAGTTLGMGDTISVDGNTHWFSNYGSTNTWMNQAAV